MLISILLAIACLLVACGLLGLAMHILENMTFHFMGFSLFAFTIVLAVISLVSMIYFLISAFITKGEVCQMIP
jgi:hypothetical protein